MNNFNLNSNSYNLTELENLLGLQVPYTIQLLDEKKISLRDKIVSMPGMDNSKRKNILVFLDNIVKRLLDNLNRDNILIPKNPSDNPIVEKVNPEVKYITKMINIDSLFRNDYYSTKSSDFTFSLPDKINKVIKMTVTNIQLPLSFYSISSTLKNNSFTVHYSSGTHTFTIPDGNYTTQLNDYATSIEIVINELIKHCGIADISNNLNFCVDRITGKSIFTDKTQTDLTIDFTMGENTNPLSFKLGWLLGFRAGKYTGPSIVSEGICHIAGLKYLFLGINDYQNSGSNNFTANFSESTLPSNIINRLNINYNTQNNQLYTNSHDDALNVNLSRNYREYFGPVDIQKLTFTLYDNFGRIIDLNYMDWSLVIELICQFD